MKIYDYVLFFIFYFLILNIIAADSDGRFLSSLLLHFYVYPQKQSTSCEDAYFYIRQYV